MMSKRDATGGRLREGSRGVGAPRSRLAPALAILLLSVVGWPLWLVAPAEADHQAHGARPEEVLQNTKTLGAGYPVPGVSFRVFIAQPSSSPAGDRMDPTAAAAVARTVIDAFAILTAHRADYPRFDESLHREALEKVVIEPRVVNREGKEFPFLVARTKDPGRVVLLISASALKDQGYVGHPDKLVPPLAREFQWVVSKADTGSKVSTAAGERSLARAPIQSDKLIRRMSGEQREEALRRLFSIYLRTVDDRRSLDGQPYYEVGTDTLVEPTQPDSTTKLYDIRVREALQKIVRETFFWNETPKAVRSLLNGKIWAVSFVKIDQRDWATRTRVVPEEKAVAVGEGNRLVQPATILVNTYRKAAPEDPFYVDTKGLAMGALTPDQLARVIALEIEHNIVEKSMKGHVAQDALTEAP